jgi:hypothetical protein
MRWLRFVMVALIVGMLATAADRELTGSVVDANTGEPIAHAHLTVRFFQAGQPAPEVTLLSDADGSFKITNLPDGQYQISCDKAGYLPASQLMAAMPPTVPPDGKRTATMVLKMTAQAAVEGTVTDDRGMPAAGTFIQLVRQQVGNGRRQFQMAGSGGTDETGSFRIFGLPAGKYYISITAHLNGSRRLKPLAYPPLFYPGALDMATAQPLDLKAGDDVAIKIRLPEPVRAFEVSGAVASGGPNFGVNLVAQPSDATFQQSSGEPRVDVKTKTFRISHVTPGMYLLTASAPQDGKGMAFATTMITVGSTDVTGIRLEPVDASLDGTVRMQGDTTQQRMSGSVSVQSERYNNGGQVDAEGKFHIPSIQPGTYRIVPQVFQQQVCVRSVLSGGRDVRDGLTIGAGAAPEPIDVVLSSHCGSVDVAVAPSDSPLPTNLTAYLLRKVGDDLVLEKQGYQGPRSGDGGTHFTIQGVAPGDYMVYVWPQDLAIEYANAEYMKQFDSYGQKVTVTEDSKVSVTVDKVLTALPK